MVTAKVVIVGDEILSGQVADTNSGYLARRLHDAGVALCEVGIIPDQREIIEQTLAEALQDFDIVITSGGLGPTPDDLTKGIAAKLFGKRMVLDDTIVQRLERHYSAAGRKMPAVSNKQALIPQGAIVLENPVGLAPGLILVRDRHSLILLPGVPLELQKILETGVIPFLEETYFLSPLLVTTVRTTGVLESEIVERLEPYFRRHRGVSRAYLVSPYGVDIRLSTEKDRKALNEAQAEIVARLDSHVYARDNTPIEAVVGELLRTRKLTLSTAESCTGGLLASRITDVPGSSEYYLGGVVAYSNDLKESLIGVSKATLRKFGAVSPETATEMALGAQQRFRSDYALSVTGIAGPAGGTDAKPVGLVYVGLAAAKKASATEFRFGGTRKLIKEQTAVAALDLLRRTLRKRGNPES